MTHLRLALLTCTAAAGLAALPGVPLSATPKPPGAWRVVYAFQQAADGTYPNGFGPIGGLVADSQGRLYGVTQQGGQANNGVVFRLTRPASGTGAPWTEEVLHSFTPGDVGPYGSTAEFSPLLLGPSGELYGSTLYGGPTFKGSIYRLDNVPGWPITILHYFGTVNGVPNSADGTQPVGTLQFGPGGLLYGATQYGGSSLSSYYGTLFSLSPQGDAVEYAELHGFQFCCDSFDGKIPSGGLTPAGPNRFVGATSAGGSNGGGTAYVFELSALNVWTERPIYSFGHQGTKALHGPMGNLTTGPGDLLYGCAATRTFGHGVFALAPPNSPGGSWMETNVFLSGGQGGECSNVTRQPTGQLLAPSLYDIAQFTPPAPGSSAWTTTEYFEFSGSGGPAGYRVQGNILPLDGEYFSETYFFGGPVPATGGGTVFAFRP